MFVPDKEIEFFTKIVQKFKFKIDKKIDTKISSNKSKTDRLTKLHKMFDKGVSSKFALQGDKLKEARYKRYAN